MTPPKVYATRVLRVGPERLGCVVECLMNGPPSAKKRVWRRFQAGRRFTDADARQIARNLMIKQTPETVVEYRYEGDNASRELFETPGRSVVREVVRAMRVREEGDEG